MSRKHLDAHTVAVIRRRHAHGDKLAHLAEHYGISESCVHNIVKHRTYKNVLDSARGQRQPQFGALTAGRAYATVGQVRTDT